MARQYKRGRGKGFPKAAKISPRPVTKERIAILESEDVIEKLCREFEVNDDQDIDDIVSGRIGEIAVEW